MSQPKWTTSFKPSEKEGILSFWNENGFVIIDNIIPQQQVDDTVDEIWENSTLLGANPDIDRDDPLTWDDSEWPFDSGKGFFESINELRDTMCWKNRQSETIVNMFQLILGHQQVWVSQDRYGMMRPTKNIRVKKQDGSEGYELVDRDEWRTDQKWLHWDQNPITEPGFKRVQGILALTDNTLDSGGFKCIPGFHKRFKKWRDETDLSACSRNVAFFLVPPNDPIQSEPIPVTFRKGSLLIWDSRLPHQNFPNHGSNFRIVQYITFSVVPSKEDALRKQRNLNDKIKNCCLGYETFPAVLSPLGRKVTGLDLWDYDDDDNNDNNNNSSNNNSNSNSNNNNDNSTTGDNHNTNDSSSSSSNDNDNGNEAENELPLEVRKEALLLLEQAEAFEKRRMLKEAVAAYRKAYKLNPALEFL